MPLGLPPAEDAPTAPGGQPEAPPPPVTATLSRCAAADEEERELAEALSGERHPACFSKK